MESFGKRVSRVRVRVGKKKSGDIIGIEIVKIDHSMKEESHRVTRIKLDTTVAPQ